MKWLMKKKCSRLLLLMTIMQTTTLFAQAPQQLLKKDLDADGQADIIQIDEEKTQIVYQLSSQQFKKRRSKPLDGFTRWTEVSPTKSGFQITFGGNRHSYAWQFRYNKTAKNIRLIGISSFNAGPANNDGSGKGSVNLLTNHFIGDYYRYDEKEEKLVKLPTIKRWLKLPKTFLDGDLEHVNEQYIHQRDVFLEAVLNLYL